MAIPRLTTERLTLRAFEERDLDAYAALCADPEVMRFLGDGRALSRADAWRQMAMILGHWTLRGFGLWAVEERATGTLLGRIGCHRPEGWPDFEIAYTLDRPYWGRGFAREGAAAALRWAYDTLGRDDAISIIRPDNHGSIRVAESLGGTHERDVEFFGAVARIYRYRRATV